MLVNVAKVRTVVSDGPGFGQRASTAADPGHALVLDLALAKAIPRAALAVRRKLAILFRHLILMGRFKRKESVIPD